MFEGRLGFWKQPRAEVSLSQQREQPRAGVWSQRLSRTPVSVRPGDFLVTALLGAWVCLSVW